MKWIFAGGASLAIAVLLVGPASMDEASETSSPTAQLGDDSSVAVTTTQALADPADADSADASALQLNIAAPPAPAEGGSINQALVPHTPETPIVVQSNDNSEINVNPSIAIESTDDVDALSSEGARACASIEVAIEAVRVQDWPQLEEVLYRAVPAASGAQEVAISQLSAELLDLGLHPNPAQSLNEMITVCVSEGHQL